MKDEIISNQVINESLQLSLNVKTEAKISSTQEDFALCEADYLRLRDGKSKGIGVALTFFLTSIGFGISFISKYVASVVGNELFAYEPWEWIAPVIAGSASLVIYLFYAAIPNEHKKVMKAIESHFKSAPRRRHVVEVENNEN
ncbi:hypothetical protein [Shewanella sp. KCT]|uniref:hypothetical protein n=1 Tax=Shewanella sp. KCT TaxID=2569535 RepID=UPI001183CE9E|nr:hypothetical protein [Shewanella sp. KCT]TVP12697.1 hypothetical protein AYI87_13455 [Shewanella sp. KCT]